MSIKKTTSFIDDVSVGRNYAGSVYLGETLVWPECNTVSDDGSVAVLRCGNSYVAPAWANSVKAWAVGAGGSPYIGGTYSGAGGVAYRTYSITPGATINYIVNQFRPGTKDTGGSHTTVVYDGIKICGFAGSGQANYLLDRLMLAHTPTYGQPGGPNGGRGGVGGTFAGAADGGAAGSPGGAYRPLGVASGAVGRGGDGLDEWNPPEIPAASSGECSRVAATNVSGLFEAVAVVDIDTTEICANRAAFGSSGVGYDDGDHAFDVKYKPGIGGGGIGVNDYGPHLVTGRGAVVLQFSAATVSNPKPAFTPMAVILTDGAEIGALTDIDGHFAGSVSSFQKYAVPAGATTVKAWAVGAGHYSAGGVAYAEWMVYSGQFIYYRIGAVNSGRSNVGASYVIAGQYWPPIYNSNRPYFIKRLLIGGSGGLAYSTTDGYSGYGGYSGGDGGVYGGGSQYTYDPGPEYSENFGGAISGSGPIVPGGSSQLYPGGPRGVGERVKPLDQDISGLFAAIALAGGSPHFGEGAYKNDQGNYLAAGLGGGGSGGYPNVGGQGCVVLYFT